MKLLSHALAYAGRTWPVFPVKKDKSPLTTHGLKDASTEEAQIFEWWTKHPAAGIGVRCGAEGAGLVVIDIDPRHGGSLGALTTLGALPATVESSTGGGGTHLLFQMPPGVAVKNRAGMLPGIDVRGDGGYIVVPPSRHSSGGTYSWRPGFSPDDLAPAVVPPWLLELLTSKNGSAPPPVASSRRESLFEGSRNDGLTRVAGALRRNGCDAETLAVLLMKVNEENCKPPLDADEVRRIATSVARYPRGRPLPLTDVGNAERFVLLHGHDIRYAVDLKQWLVWDSVCWSPGSQGALVRRAKFTARCILDESSSSRDDLRRQSLSKWACQTEGRGRINNMIALAQSAEEVEVRQHMLDSHDMLLNAANGTINLENTVLTKHDRDQLLTKYTNIKYERGAKCPTWLQFLDRVLGSNEELIAFVQRAIGYSITAKVSEQKLFFLYGSGANGKSTFCQILLDLLGPYATMGAPGLLVAKRGDTHPTEQADLAGTRVAVIQEVEQNRALAEVTVKQLTGGDTVKARRMREDFWTFRPTHKFWIAGNHKPRVKGTDNAIWRRVLLIPFVVTIPEAEQDKNLLEKLRSELTGILSWAVDGASLWCDYGGLCPPIEVTNATNEYRNSEDIVSQFIEERCDVNPADSQLGGELYEAFVDWCRSSGEAVMSNRSFGDRLGDLGYAVTKCKQGRLRHGLSLK